MSDVIPAQIQQLPGRDFTYDNNPSAFEAILGGVGAFLNSKAEQVKQAEQRRSTEMGQAFAAMISRGLVEPGKAPSGRDTFTYGGSPFYYTQPGAERTSALGAEDQANIAYKKAQTAQIGQEMNPDPESMLPQLMKAQTASPGFAIASMQDPVGAGAAAVRSSYAMVDEMAAQQAARKPKTSAKTSTSSGKSVKGGKSTLDKARELLKASGYKDDDQSVADFLKKNPDFK